jgi:hypothetical protein
MLLRRTFMRLLWHRLVHRSARLLQHRLAFTCVRYPHNIRAHLPLLLNWSHRWSFSGPPTPRGEPPPGCGARWGGAPSPPLLAAVPVTCVHVRVRVRVHVCAR